MQRYDAERMLSHPENIAIARLEAPPPRADQANAGAAASARVAQLVELIQSLTHSADPHEGLEGLANGVLRSGRAAYAEIITSPANPRHYTIERLRTDDGQDMLRGLAQVEAARESSFFANILTQCGIEFVNLIPNSVLLLAIFQHLGEGFLGILPTPLFIFPLLRVVSHHGRF